MGDFDLVTLVVIAVNIIFSYKGFNDQSFFEKYKFNSAAVKRGEKIRVLTSGFLHVDTAHLFLNMLTLFFFADVVIGSLGSVSFLLIYLASLLLGNLLSYYFHKDEYQYNAVGASGAVSGIIYAAILLYPDMSLYMFFIPIPIPAYVFGIGYMLYSIYGMKNRIGNIGHDAHFGGAVGGYILTLLLVPQLFVTSLFMVILLAIPIVLLFFLQKSGKF
ncbi:rhomboid family intramembrane serine protease [Salinimicrobium tongyeongense]|jgi:membrane associated rhomboid family serine protease|uniref:Rhomboid family intramembrane serine protease n=1 Tax=Salinimicrobium tongyeongense TaxID=2809707 RepID=A0ABY6NRU4_9FLAO|nr:rhomboid family intramembrane serine protease [Salinimicrobium tongyeongense]UZH55553.1 rhomboid family intramembrane serine protease [Salinimicrobium tongyeongense]